MLYLVTHYWFWLAAAFVIGVATPLVADKAGWAADLEDYWLSRIGVAIAILLAVVVAKIATGPAGLMLDAAAGLVIAYVIGGVAGGIAPGLLPGRFEGWWVGLFATGLLWGVFGITAMPQVAPDLRAQVAEVIKDAGADPLNFDVAGRDVLLPAAVAGGQARADLAARIAAVPGVRQVSDVEDLTGAALAVRTVARLQAEADKTKPAAADASRTAAATPGDTAAPTDTAAREAAEAIAKETAHKEAAHKEALAKAAAETAAQKAERDAAEEAARRATIARMAEQAAAEPPHVSGRVPAASATASPPAPIKTADAAGTALLGTAAACQSRVSAAAEKINFARGSAEIDAASLPVISRLAAAIAQCPAVTIEVGGHTDARGKPAANEALSQRRAEAVVAALTQAGIGAAKLVAAGYGAAKPIAGNDTAEGRAHNRRIEFVVK